MKQIFRLLTLICAATLIYACDGREKIDYQPTQETGKLQMRMKLVANADSTPGSSVAGTKNIATRAVSCDNFIITIYKAGTEEIAIDVNNENAVYTYSAIPEIITLPTGKYYIRATSHNLPPAEWEKPYYLGQSETFEIKKSEITRLPEDKTITCTQANVKITVEYTEELKKELASYSVIISNGEGFLEFKAGEKRAGYFKATPLTATLKGVRTDGEVIDHTSQVSDVKPGQAPINFVFNIVFSTLNSTLDISMKMEIVDKDITIKPGDDPLIPSDPDPDPDPTPDPDPDPSDGLSIIGQGFDIKEPVRFPVGATKTVIVNITADNGVKDLWVDIKSPFLTEDELAGIGLPKKFNLADPAMYTQFGPAGLGLVSSPVRDSKQLVFDITKFTQLLLSAGTHNFVLTLIDNNNQVMTETLALTNY